MSSWLMVLRCTRTCVEVEESEQALGSLSDQNFLMIDQTHFSASLPIPQYACLPDNPVYLMLFQRSPYAATSATAAQDVTTQ
jgi:hypothetical protein